MSTLCLDIKKLTGRTFQNHRLVNLLGSGAFGAVYGADSPNGSVAVKFSVDMPSATNEAEILLILKGTPYVPQLISSGTEDGFHVIVMSKGFIDLDVLRGRNAESNLKFSPPNILKILHQAVTAIEFIHIKNILHRDIKPNNFVISHPVGPNMMVKLLLIDFGWACKFGNEDEDGEPKSSAGLRHCSAKVQQGARNRPIDDLFQLSYASIALCNGSMSGFFLSGADLLDYKLGLMTDPENFLTRFARWLHPIFSTIGAQDTSPIIDYNGIRNAIQDLLPTENVAGDLELTNINGILKLN